ncbi:MAG: hypothetical protein IJT82_08125 [Schwartzia sp.]|nr:hypothetical protein [Schwartzia sp. (in: firmicutes)]
MRKYIAAGFLIIVFAAAALLSRYVLIRQDAVMGGRVTWVIELGENVNEGDAILKVAALSGGDVVASRATAAGTVEEVNVKVGDNIKSGTMILRLKKR